MFARFDAVGKFIRQRLEASELEIGKRKFGAKPDLGLPLYAHLLQWALSEQDDLERVVMVDYGGGVGLLSVFASLLGVGTVIYGDIYDVSVHDAGVVARKLRVPDLRFVCGNEMDLVSYMSQEGLHADVVVTNDVIEHIYDSDQWMATVCEHATALAIASSANPLNPRTKRLTERLHREVEETNRPRREGQKERDTLRAWREVRAEIIRRCGPGLKPTEVDLLAGGTRGLAEHDIRACVQNYCATRAVPVPAHPTNTCDPITGNWAERLINPYDLLARAEGFGFRGRVLAGYYPSYANRTKHVFTRALNWLIAHSGAMGLRLAPHYLLYASKTGA